jgi:hypothetical protein
LLSVVTYASLRISGRRGLRAAALALGAVALWLEPVYMTMFFGQINIILRALVMVGHGRSCPAGLQPGNGVG